MMRMTTRSQTASQRQPAQLMTQQPAITEEQRAHALNNIIEVESQLLKEEVREEVAAASIEISAIPKSQEPEEEK